MTDALSAGSRIGPYEINREIGRGGMGVVYLARDTKLDRDVAIKALPEELADDVDRLARFEREAKLLAQLSHTNIAGIHGIEEQDGHKYLILEYVEGETLAERLDRGALPVDEALEIAIEIAAGVKAAHEAGIIHRDLKPDNIKITPDGHAKVLDFGLARTTEGVSGSSVADAATVTSPTPRSPTDPGAILGTAPYMSPEQARGRRLDKRSDIWSFGVILYEMLTGASPFVGETVSDSIGAILHKDIDLKRLPSATPPMVRHVLRRCLARDKALRYHDIGDAALDLSDRLETATAIIGSNTSTRYGLIGWLLALIALAAVVVQSIRSFSGNPDSDASVIRLDMSAPPGMQFIQIGDSAGPPVVSPGGEMIAFVARTESDSGRLWVRDLESGSPRVLPGTDEATFPFWSPDGHAIGFFTRNQLRRHDLDSGVSYKVCDATGGRGGTWTPENEILFSPGFQEALFRVPADGGEPTPLTTLDKSLHTSHRWPFILPDGERFLFSAITHDPSGQENNMLLVGALDSSEPTMLLRSPYRSEYANGKLLYIVGEDLVAATLDLKTLNLSSQRVVLAESVIVDASTWYASFSADPGGVLTYVTSDATIKKDSRTDFTAALGAEADTLIFFDRQGVIPSIMFDNIPHMSLRLSPDAQSIAITGALPGQPDIDIWTFPTSMDENYFQTGDLTQFETAFNKGSALKRVTSMPGSEVVPAWSPDGSKIAYGRIWGPEDAGGIFITDLESYVERRIVPPDPQGRDLYTSDWTPDGEWIIFVIGSWIGDTGTLHAIHPEGGEPVLLIERNNSIDHARVSPDGRWLAFSDSLSGEIEVFVVPFAPAWPDLNLDPTDPAPIWRVSIAEGTNPMWRNDGRELYYVSPSGAMIVVETEIEGDIFKHDTGVTLFQSSHEQGKAIDVLPNGQGFFMSDVQTGMSARVVITLNWQRLLKDGGVP